MGLTGVVDGEPVTLAIFDHPSNHGHPPYWHARGYGLFAVNPFGRHGYDPAQPAASLTLQPAQQLSFRYRILVLSEHLTAGQLSREHQQFAAPPSSARR